MNKIVNKNPKLSGIIIAKNAEYRIEHAIESLKFCNEIVVIDTGSSDDTKKISEKLGSKVFDFEGGSYPDWRNFGSQKATGNYLLYLDTDEEIGEKLAGEIEGKIISWKNGVGCYAIPRKNIVFGKWLKHGGWYPDYVVRLFKKENLIRWENKLHEQPVYKGNLEYLENAIIHHKEGSVSEMVPKTNKWSEIEARLMFDSGHPPMNIWRFLGAMFREFWFRFVKNLAFLDGGEGIIMGVYQIFSRFVSYAKLWELQLYAGKRLKSKI